MQPVITKMLEQIPGRVIFFAETGSYLYGTNLETSDHDYKAVYIPTLKSILTGKVKKTLSLTTGGDGKNTSEDIDIEVFSLDQYLRLLSQGQTNALEMLFIKNALITSNIWKDLCKDGYKFANMNAGAFVGYCKAQAYRYGNKGNRLSTIEKVLEVCQTLDQDEHIYRYEYHWTALIKDLPNIQKIMIEIRRGHPDLKPALDICGRKFAFSDRVKSMTDSLIKLKDTYGSRSKSAKADGGVDYKALMHAVRIIDEAIELAIYGELDFPRSGADLYKDIRQKKIPFDEISNLIESKMETFDQIKKSEVKPDLEAIDQFVFDVYKEAE
jgi:hypothetical protein